MQALIDKIDKQIGIGFDYNEIVENLKTEGYSEEEIKKAMQKLDIEPELLSSKRKPWGIIMGFVFLAILIFRVLKLQENMGAGAIFGIIGVISAGLLAILKFSGKGR